ncbi:MAG TPA: hypothetical protein VF665_01355 [Longimicrobium sp.]|jgi:hypothetical protein|uniref:hypothetical protein n=1 Tax=Longimicrobium sp. TaxID=2029185 RepID=UPI002ED9DC06
MNGSPLEAAFGRRQERGAAATRVSGAFRGIRVGPIVRWVLLGVNAALLAVSGLVAGLIWLVMATAKPGPGPDWLFWVAAVPPTLCAAGSLWNCWQLTSHARCPWAVQATSATAFVATFAALQTLSV